MSSIRVVCRFRPQNKNELAQGGCSIITVNDNQTVNINGAESNHNFTFDSVYTDKWSQKQVYDDAAKPVIEDIMQGYNGTIFVYGQTSSGKTHTMQGPSIDDPELKGVIPRMINTVFECISKAEEHIEFIVKASYIEIYMERIRDLLDTRKDNLKVREEKGKGVWVEGTTEVYIYREDDILEVMRTGQANRAIAETKMNAESSRSHSIFILSIQQKNLKEGSLKSGKLYLVDLAGSEKISKTGAQGTTLDEAKMINKSLSSLGNVINALTDGKSTHIPYRDSKLTRVLQESLGGNSRTTLVINCSPSSYNEAETLSTLRFGSRAKNIKNKAKINQERSAAELKILLQKAEKEIESLKNYIKELESVSGVKSSNVGGSGGSNSSSPSSNNTSNPSSSLDSGNAELLKSLQEKCIALEKQLFQKEEEKKDIMEQLESQSDQIADKDQELETYSHNVSSLKEQADKFSILSQQVSNENSLLSAQLTDLKLSLEKSKYESTEQTLLIEGLNSENSSLKSEINVLLEKIDKLNLNNNNNNNSSNTSNKRNSLEIDAAVSPSSRPIEDPSVSVSKHAEEWNEKAEQLKLLQRTPSKVKSNISGANNSTSSPLTTFNLSNNSTSGGGDQESTNEIIVLENVEMKKKIKELQDEFEQFKLEKEKERQEKELEYQQELLAKTTAAVAKDNDGELPSEMILQAEQLRRLLSENTEQKINLEDFKSENSKLKSRIENIEEETRLRMEEELNLLREQTNQKLSEFGILKESLFRDLENRCQKVIDLELALDEYQDRVTTLTERLKRANKINNTPGAGGPNGSSGGDNGETALVQLKLDEVTSIKHQLAIENNKYKNESQRSAKQLALRNEHILLLENTLKESQDRLYKLALNHEAVTLEYNRLKSEIDGNKKVSGSSSLSNNGQINGARIVKPLRGGGGVQGRTPLSTNLYSNTMKNTKELNSDNISKSPLTISSSNSTSSNNLLKDTSGNPSISIGVPTSPNITSSNNNNNGNISGNTTPKLQTENSSSSIWGSIFRKKTPSTSPNITPSQPLSPNNISPSSTPMSPIPVSFSNNYAPAIPTSPSVNNNNNTNNNSEQQQQQ